MPKAVPLTPAVMETPLIAPSAAISTRAAAKQAPMPKPELVPLQVRLPRDEVRAIKIAAAEREQTISDLMLACFHAYMKLGEHT